MQYRKMENTDLTVSVIGYGGWAIADEASWGEQDPAVAVQAVRAAFDSGITFFDTAETYGNGLSETLFAQALHDVRDRVVLATKVSRPHYMARKMIAACEKSLAALRTDRIDLYQLHWPAADLTVDEMFEGLETLRKQGKIRHAGVCNFGVKDLTAGLRRKKPVASNQLAYNLLFRAIESEILPLCRKQGIPIVAYSPLLHGILTGKYPEADRVPGGRARTRHFSCHRPNVRHGEPGAEPETFEALDAVCRIAREIGESATNVSLAWVLSQPGVACAIMGARTPFQARRNARAGNLALSETVIRQLSAATDALKERMGSNADLWQSESRIR